MKHILFVLLLIGSVGYGQGSKITIKSSSPNADAIVRGTVNTPFRIVDSAKLASVDSIASKSYARAVGGVGGTAAVLYNSIGNNTDGALTQNAATTALGQKVNASDTSNMLANYKNAIATATGKLATIATGATVNSTDASLRDRTSHTGVQPISSVSGLQSALDAKASSQAISDSLNANTFILRNSKSTGDSIAVASGSNGFILPKTTYSGAIQMLHSAGDTSRSIIIVGKADSTATANALAGKAPLTDPTFSGTPKIGSDTIATRAYSRSVGGGSGGGSSSSGPVDSLVFTDASSPPASPGSFVFRNNTDELNSGTSAMYVSGPGRFYFGTSANPLYQLNFKNVQNFTSIPTLDFTGNMTMISNGGAKYIERVGTEMRLSGDNYYWTSIWAGIGERMRVTQSGIAMNTNADATSTLQVGGSFATAYVEKTAAYTLTANDHTVNCTSGTFTITFPTAVGIAGRIYVIRNSGAGTITLATTSSQPITATTVAAGAVAQYQSTNAGWIKIN